MSPKDTSRISETASPHSSRSYSLRPNQALPGHPLSCHVPGTRIRSQSRVPEKLGLIIAGVVISHISDIPSTSEAIAMIKEAQTIHLFRQEHDDDIADCVRYFNLEQSNAAALGALPQGDHLLKVGTHKEIRVHHRRTAREEHFTATDSAMLLSTNKGVADVPA